MGAEDRYLHQAQTQDRTSLKSGFTKRAYLSNFGIIHEGLNNQLTKTQRLWSYIDWLFEIFFVRVQCWWVQHVWRGLYWKMYEGPGHSCKQLMCNLCFWFLIWLFNSTYENWIVRNSVRSFHKFVAAPRPLTSVIWSKRSTLLSIYFWSLLSTLWTLFEPFT